MATKINNLLSIKDFSKLTGIKQSTLRYYDELGLFSPSKRGENSYRYYSPQQITTIKSISLLHELDMPIKQISDIQKNRSPELLFNVLNNKEEALAAELAHLERSYNVVRTLKRIIQVGLVSGEQAVETSYFDELPIVIGPKNDFKHQEYFFDAFLDFCAVASEYRIDLMLPIGGMFNNYEAFSANPGRPEHFFSIDPRGNDKRRAGKFVAAFQRGYYGEAGDIVERMNAYIKAKGLKPIGPVYNIFLHGELCITEPAEYLSHFVVEVV